MPTNAQRKNTRLSGYDYSQDGYYFVTICTKDRYEFFAKISNGQIQLNILGEVVQRVWENLPKHYHNCFLDEFIIMPNHVHGIIVIDNQSLRNGLKPFPTGGNNNSQSLKQYSVSEIIRGFKSFSSREINKIYGKKVFSWQKSFFDHIIRRQKSFDEIRKYIRENPLSWKDEKDRNHFSNVFFES